MHIDELEGIANTNLPGLLAAGTPVGAAGAAGAAAGAGAAGAAGAAAGCVENRLLLRFQRLHHQRELLFLLETKTAVTVPATGEGIDSTDLSFCTSE